MNKIRVYHFHNGKPGGVHAVINNLVRFSANPLIENHVIQTINTDVPNPGIAQAIAGAVTEQVFYYSARWNFYHTCKQLARLLRDDNAIVVAHDWLELGMLSNLGLKNPAVFFLHGDYEYYYQLATKHERSIDLFIPVAQLIELKLKSLISHRTNDISYLRFPVPAIPFLQKETTGNIIFIGRLQADKGYHLLPGIAEKIKEKNINLQWHIVGAADDSLPGLVKWGENIHVKFYGSLPHAEVLAVLADMQILILPSLREGMPVVVIEAMKAGVIPLVNDIDGGVQELVMDNETGYKIKDNEVDIYVAKIIELVENKNLAGQMQTKCIALANDLFDPVKNTIALEDKVVGLFAIKRKSKQSFKVYGSRLDAPWIPNWIVKVIRKGLIK